MAGHMAGVACGHCDYAHLMGHWSASPSPEFGSADARRARLVGFAAVFFSGLYFLSDVIEAVQGGFSWPQLTLTLVGEAAVPFFVVGLYRAQRPEIGRLGLVTAIAYAYSYVFFTGTVIYAMLCTSSNSAALPADLGVSMTVHGAVMVGVVAVAAAQTAPGAIALAAAGIRAAAFVGMGIALLRSSANPIRGT